MTVTCRAIAEERRAEAIQIDSKRTIVYCYSDNELVKAIDCDGKSHYWVSECIENWCNGIIKE